MVLGLRNKNRRGPSIQVDYIIQVQDIKPWPPTQTLKSVRSILIQWENGERNSGSTSSVAPSVDDGKIEFNESFRLSVMLSRDMSVKNGDADVFHKNLVEFNLYEPRRDKTVKGQLLGTAIVDLADYGIVNNVVSVCAPMNCTRSFRNTTQPVLHLKIQTYDKVRSGSSLRGRLAKEASLDKNDGDSVSALMSEEYADEAEVASLTDDDISSQSSLTAASALESSGASLSQNENGSGRGRYHAGMGKENHDLAPKLASAKSGSNYESNENHENMKDYSSDSVSTEFSSTHGKPDNVPASLSDTSELDSESNSENIFASGAKSSTSCQAHESGQVISEEVATTQGRPHTKAISEEDPPIFTTKVIQVDATEKLNSENEPQHQASGERKKKYEIPGRNSSVEVAATGDTDYVHEQIGKAGEMLGEEKLLVGVSSNRFSLDAVRKPVLSGSDSPLIRDRGRHVKSVRSLMDSSKSNDSAGGFFGSIMKQEAKVCLADKRSTSFDSRTQELEQRIKMLERELREAAAVEVALYSVVAEHGSSINKVHAPARRLSRLYLQAGKGKKRASAAQSAVSGLVVVAKACGNDVPRLTFWLSNCVVLRAILSETSVEEELRVSVGPLAEKNGVGKGMDKKSTLKWKVSSSDKQANKSVVRESSQDWEDPHAFMSALEKVESWIFSRIVESVWWQTLTPHMQSSAAKTISKVVDSGFQKNYRRTCSSGDQEQVNFSLELWKKAFKDACERLCPVRAGGHECGCLPVLAKLIMEQCVARLDVAMFNAILRESADDIPTDPVSDPISDAKVLPIPAGKSSFGAGAQLKNAIGNWSRWLTDLFGMDDDDAPEDERNCDDDDDEERHTYDSPFKSFYLLKSFSDLMMLPKDMLLSESIRREVCPTFGSQLIRRVLENFVPDEFCPDPIPGAVFEALDSEDNHAEGERSIMNFPSAAPPVFYSPPSAFSLASIMGGNLGTGRPSPLQRIGSVLRRSNTSDDELDELHSPLNSVLGEYLQPSPNQMKPNWKVVETPQKNVVRYQLLREVWDDGVEL